MGIPSFTAERSLYRRSGQYRVHRTGAEVSSDVIPAIPACSNCDYILDNCARNGGRPRALCNACAHGWCYTEAPMPNPYPDPFPGFPRF